MKRKFTTVVLTLLILSVVLTASCLISGTFIFVEDFNFTADTGWYWYPVDLTSNADWREHKDKLDRVEQVGFEMTIQNTSDIDTEFNVWFVPASDPVETAVKPNVLPEFGAPVITGLFVPANSTKKISYAESLGIIINARILSQIVQQGRFDYYGYSTGGSGDFPFNVTDGKIIVTLSASET